VRVALHWVGEHASVALDVAGGSLHARGYRLESGEAPLKETLAAAIVRLSGWDRRSAFIDPMCGAGTLAIEAAQWGRSIAPGLLRERFGFERWSCHGDAERRVLSELRQQARDESWPANEAPPIMARDLDEKMLVFARRNAARAGVRIDFARADVRTMARTPASAWLVTNPPYGERLAHSATLDRELADALRRLRGWRACVLAQDRDLERAMRQKPLLEHALWNGPIECRLFCWQIV
jgi:putative N6-adenine-specific DNA methylase